MRHLNQEVVVKQLGDITYFFGLQIEKEEDRSDLLNQK